MEKAMESKLSLGELETVAGGKDVVMNGDTWRCTGDGHPVRVARKDTLANRIINFLFH
jgi:hypothetical protein